MSYLTARRLRKLISRMAHNPSVYRPKVRGAAADAIHARPDANTVNALIVARLTASAPRDCDDPLSKGSTLCLTARIHEPCLFFLCSAPAGRVAFHAGRAVKLCSAINRRKFQGQRASFARPAFSSVSASKASQSSLEQLADVVR